MNKAKGRMDRGPEKYTGKAWKHHIAEDFEKDPKLLGPGNGAGANSTIFLDYDYMVQQLRTTRQRWYIAELDLQEEPLYFQAGVTQRATTTRDIESKEGFKPIP